MPEQREGEGMTTGFIPHGNNKTLTTHTWSLVIKIALQIVLIVLWTDKEISPSTSVFQMQLYQPVQEERLQTYMTSLETQLKNQTREVLAFVRVELQ